MTLQTLEFNCFYQIKQIFEEFIKKTSKLPTVNKHVLFATFVGYLFPRVLLSLYKLKNL